MGRRHGFVLWLRLVHNSGWDILVLIDRVHFTCLILKVFNHLGAEQQKHTQNGYIVAPCSNIATQESNATMMSGRLQDFHVGFSVKYCESYVFFNRLLWSRKRKEKKEIQGRWKNKPNNYVKSIFVPPLYSV